MEIVGPGATVGPGTTQNYTLTINNPSTSETLLDIDLLLSLAAGLQLANPSAIGCAGTSGVQICNTLGTLAPSGTAVFSFQLIMPTVVGTPPQQTYAIVYSGSASNPASAPGRSLSTTVSMARSLSISGDASPSPVESGGAFTYSLDATLSGPNLTWDGISITLTAPALVQLGSASGSGFQCTGDSSQQLCNSITPASGQTTRSLSIPASVPIVPTNTPVTATISAAGSFLSAPSISVAQTVVAAPIDLALSKTLESSNPAAPGSLVEFRLAVSNDTVVGGAAVSGFQLTDSLPAGLAFESASGANWNCAGSSTVTCSFTGSLSPQQTTSFILSARAADSAAGLLTNTATLVGVNDSNSGNNSASASVSIQSPRLTLQKSAPASGLIGAALEYTLLVGNTGTTTAVDVVVLDELPASLNLLSVSGEGCNTTSPVRCVIPSLAPNSSRSIVIRTQPTTIGTLVNSAQASSGRLNVNASATTLIDGRIDLEMRKSGPATVDPGDRVDYQLAVRNIGSAPSASVVVQDSLPGELELISVQGAGWSCSTGSPISCSLDSPLAAGSDAAVIQVQTRLSSTTSASLIRNTATVSAAEDVNPANDSSSVDTRVSSEPPPPRLADLVLTLDPDPAGYPATGTSEVNFSGNLRNLGPDAATGIELDGELVGDAQLLGVTIGADSCVDLINCQITNIPPGATRQIRIRANVVAENSPAVVLQLGVGANEQDPNSGNNFDSVSAIRDDLLSECCDLALSAQAASRADLGSEVTVNATLRNLSGEVSTGARVDIDLGGLEFRSASGASCTASASSVLCSIGTLAGGASSVFSVVVAGTAAGDATLTLVSAFDGTDPNPTNNQAELAIGIDRTPDEVIDTIMGIIDDPLVEQAGSAVINICTTGTADLRAQCNAIVESIAGGDTQAATQAVYALLPEEILGQGASVNQLSQVQFDNIDTRQAELRGGATGFSADGLGFSTGTQSFSVGMLKGLFANDDSEPEIGGSGDLISRWGGFVNGMISSGNQDTDRAGELDFDVVGITAGVDYRQSYRWVIGAAVGYNKFDSDLVDDGKLETRAFTLSAYSAYYPTDRFYVDGRLSLGNSTIESERRILIPGVVDATAFGETDVSQTSIAASFGYQMAKGSWTFTPNASVQFVRSEFDAFTETGAGDNNARFASQTSNSTQISLGVQLSKAISLSHGVLAPQVDLALTRELSDDGAGVNATLAGAPDVEIQVQSDGVDQSFGNVGLGVVYVTANGRQAFLSYRRLVGADGLERGTINFGVRFEF